VAIKVTQQCIMFYKIIMFVARFRGLKRTQYISGLVELVTNNSSKGVKLIKMEIFTNARKTTSKNCYLWCCPVTPVGIFTPKWRPRHLVAVTKKASEFHLLFFYTLC